VTHATLLLDATRDSQVFGRVTEQDRQECRFPGAVSTDQPDLLTIAHREGHGVEDATCTDLDPQISNDQHLST
jgi:hypothetical protein